MNSTPSDAEIKAHLRGLLARTFRDRVIKDDDDILALGFGDSLFAIQLVNFVEKTFDIEIDSDDLDMVNFRSIDAVAGLVSRKLAAQAD